jgi:hypothetical protein
MNTKIRYATLSEYFVDLNQNQGEGFPLRQVRPAQYLGAMLR